MHLRRTNGILMLLMVMTAAGLLFAGNGGGMRYPGLAAVSSIARGIDTIEVSAERRGKLKEISVAVGDRVKQGQVLARLDDAEFAAQRKEAQTLLNYQESKLADMRHIHDGYSANVDDAKLQGARDALKNASQLLVVALREAYAKADDAVRGKADQFFTKTRQILISGPDLQFNLDVGVQRDVVEQALVAWKNRPLPSAYDALLDYTSRAEADLNQVSDFLDMVALAVNGQSVDPALAAVRNGKSDIYTARINVTAAMKSVVAAEGTVRDGAYKVSQLQADAGHSAISDKDLSLQDAQVNEARARLNILNAQASQFTIVAPVRGTVVSVTAIPGTVVAPGNVMITLQP